MEKFDITGVPETMIQTLYARAKESKKEKHVIYDEKAIEIVERMDYDFSKADKDFAMGAGVVARTILLDRMVDAYVKHYPDATVINIACGMDTRFYRVDNGRIRWINIDLPETIAVRERFLEENDRVSMMACSAMDEEWARRIGDIDGNVLVVVEGLTMYLTEEDVRQILTIINEHYKQATVYMEIMSPLMVKTVKEKSIAQSNAKFTWGAKSGEKLCELVPAFQHVRDRSLVEGMKEMYPIYKVIGKIGFIRNMSNKLAMIRNY